MKRNMCRILALGLSISTILTSVNVSAEIQGDSVPSNKIDIVEDKTTRENFEESTELSEVQETVLYSVNSNNYIAGDVNKDAKVSVEDIVTLKRYLSGKYDLSIDENAADVDADGQCTENDLDILRKYVVGGYGVELKKNEVFTISYHLFDGDSYLETIEIENKNPVTYTSKQNVKLLNLSAKGYKFDGWYDGEGKSAVQIKEIVAGETGNKDLYAHWTPIEYTVQFDSELYPVASITYTTNKGTTLGTNPTLPGYIFTGWTDENNKSVSQIKKGTTGNITLHANWTSKRNQVRPVNSLENPVIYYDEDLNCIQFAYEIGTIENVPLYEIEYLGNKANGITYTKTTTTSKSISTDTANTISETVAKATTQTNSWTLSKDWNVSVIDSSTHESESSESSTDESESGSSTGGETEHKGSSGGSNTSTTGGSLSAKIGSSRTASDVLGINAEISGEVHNDVEKKRTWNSEYGYKTTNNTTSSSKHMETLNSKIANSSTHSFSKSDGGSESSSVATTTSCSDSRECASSFTYSTQDAETSTIQYSNENAPEGYYRVVCAGTLVVYAVVNYDIATKSYGVFTYSMLEDEVKDFLDYSKVSSKFDDYINGVLPFEVPIFVNEYVDSVVGGAEKNGFVIDIDSGEVVDYYGEKTDIVIPEYITADAGDGITSVVKVTGITSGAFAGKKITSINLCDSITTIPDNAFYNCIDLQTINAPGVISIGDNAFSGCTSLNDYTVSNSIISIGNNAFAGVNKITVNAANIDVAQAAARSGAKVIVLNVSSVGEALNHTTLEVSNSVESFTLNGNLGTYTDFRIISDANETTINKINIVGTASALKTSSSKVTLNRVTMEASGFAMILSSDYTDLLLNGTIQVKSTGENAVLCKAVSMKRLSASVVGKLNCTGNVMTCGLISDNSLLNFVTGSSVQISVEQFDSLYNDNWSDWSDWTTTPVKASLNTEVETKVQYRYCDKQTTSSTDSSLSGWTQYGTPTTSYGPWGGWSSWGIDAIGGSDTRNVETATVYGYYYYLCQYCGNHSYSWDICRPAWSGWSGCGRPTGKAANQAVMLFTTVAFANAGLKDCGGTGKYYTDNFAGGRWYQWQGPYTGYRYQDRSKTVTYYYYKWNNWSAWSDTEYTSDSTRQVQTRTVYRSRTRQ